MTQVKFKIRKRIDFDFVNNYDLLVIPTFPFIKKIKVGKIKITSGRRIDSVYLKIPYNHNTNSKELVLDCYRKLLDIIKVNEYKNILINNVNISLINECCNFDNKDICHDVYNLINDYIKDMDINIVVVINNKKYCFE